MCFCEHKYISDNCQLLREDWEPQVMIIIVLYLYCAGKNHVLDLSVGSWNATYCNPAHIKIPFFYQFLFAACFHIGWYVNPTYIAFIFVVISIVSSVCNALYLFALRKMNLDVVKNCSAKTWLPHATPYWRQALPVSWRSSHCPTVFNKNTFNNKPLKTELEFFTWSTKIKNVLK